MGRYIEILTKPRSQIQKAEALFYASGIVFISLVNVFVSHPYMQAILHQSMKIRVACCSLVYRKVGIFFFWHWFILYCSWNQHRFCFRLFYIFLSSLRFFLPTLHLRTQLMIDWLIDWLYWKGKSLLLKKKIC